VVHFKPFPPSHHIFPLPLSATFPSHLPSYTCSITICILNLIIFPLCISSPDPNNVMKLCIIIAKIVQMHLLLDLVKRLLNVYKVNRNQFVYAYLRLQISQEPIQEPAHLILHTCALRATDSFHPSPYPHLKSL